MISNYDVAKPKKRKVIQRVTYMILLSQAVSIVRFSGSMMHLPEFGSTFVRGTLSGVTFVRVILECSLVCIHNHIKGKSISTLIGANNETSWDCNWAKLSTSLNWTVLNQMLNFVSDISDIWRLVTFGYKSHLVCHNWFFTFS